MQQRQQCALTAVLRFPEGVMKMFCICVMAATVSASWEHSYSPAPKEAQHRVITIILIVLLLHSSGAARKQHCIRLGTLKNSTAPDRVLYALPG